jgi:beta-lactamase class A
MGAMECKMRCMMAQLVGRLAVAASLLAAMACSAQDAPLQKQIDGIIAAHHGKVALWAMDLHDSKRSVGVNPDTPVQTASVIKLAILYEAMVEVREGKAHWDEKITLKPGEAVGGSGMLHFFDAPMTLTLKDVLTFMVIVSDNTATNLAIDRFGVDAVNTRMELLGLSNTHLYKKVMKPPTGPMPADQPKFGLGKTTPREMGTLMEDIGECRIRQLSPGDEGPRLVGMDSEDKAVCEVALTMLKSQFYQETIPRYLKGGDGTTASKTGSLDAVRNDVAIVAGKSGPMVLSIFTYDNADHGWTVDNEGEVTIAKLAKAIVNAWSPDGLDAKTLVPGLGLDKSSAK